MSACDIAARTFASTGMDEEWDREGGTARDGGVGVVDGRRMRVLMSVRV